jgi:hypothetical protein
MQEPGPVGTDVAVTADRVFQEAHSVHEEMICSIGQGMLTEELRQHFLEQLACILEKLQDCLGSELIVNSPSLPRSRRITPVR